MILSEDRPEWLYVDLGIQCAGWVSVGIYATSSADLCGYIVGHSEARIWVVEDQEQFEYIVIQRPEELGDVQPRKRTSTARVWVYYGRCGVIGAIGCHRSPILRAAGVLFRLYDPAAFSGR